MPADKQHRKTGCDAEHSGSASRNGSVSQRQGRITSQKAAINNSSAPMTQTKPVGFLYLKETGTATVELYVMGVLKEYHRQGIGRELFQSAKEAAGKAGYSFMQVKTVQMGKYEEYDRTNQFYLSLGF